MENVPVVRETLMKLKTDEKRGLCRELQSEATLEACAAYLFLLMLLLPKGICRVLRLRRLFVLHSVKAKV